MRNYVLTYYDLNDNIIEQFDTYKECAAYFEVPVMNIINYIARQKKLGTNTRKWNKKTKIWGYLIKDNF